MHVRKIHKIHRRIRSGRVRACAYFRSSLVHRARATAVTYFELSGRLEPPRGLPWATMTNTLLSLSFPPLSPTHRIPLLSFSFLRVYLFILSLSARPPIIVFPPFISIFIRYTRRSFIIFWFFSPLPPYYRPSVSLFSIYFSPSLFRARVLSSYIPRSFSDSMAVFLSRALAARAMYMCCPPYSLAHTTVLCPSRPLLPPPPPGPS